MADLSNFPIVSIITPTYNQGEFLESTINSVLNQDYPSIEYLVFDGGSTDNTIDLLKKYGHWITYWESKQDRGSAHAINKGILQATGEYLGWLNSDDMLAPGAIRKIIDTFSKYPDVDVIYGRLSRIDEKGNIIPTPILPKDQMTFCKNFLLGDCLVNQPGALWHRHISEKVGFLNEELQYAYDYEYWIRMALADAVFLRLPEILAYFRISRKSKTVTHSESMAIEQLWVLNKVAKQNNLIQELNLSEPQFNKKLRYARSIIGLHASYGFLKKNELLKAINWLGFSLFNDVWVVFQSRWIKLAIARLIRAFRYS